MRVRRHRVILGHAGSCWGMPSFRSVDDYVASFPDEVRHELEAVRHTIREALPGCEDRISYDIALVTLDGRGLFYFAGWKKHLSLYPVPELDEGYGGRRGAVPVGREHAELRRHSRSRSTWCAASPCCTRDERRPSRSAAWLVAQRHRAGAELLPADELQVECCESPANSVGAVAGQPGMHDELVLVDQAHLGQRQRELTPPGTAPSPAAA